MVDREEKQYMELQVDTPSSTFLVPSAGLAHDPDEGSPSTLEDSTAEVEASFPLRLFETNKPLFDLAMRNAFALLG